MYRRLLLAAALAAGTGGCITLLEPDWELEVTAGRIRVRVGDPLTVRVRNTGDRTVYLGRCPSALVTPGEPRRRVELTGECEAALVVLREGESATLGTQVPATVTPGQYQILVTYSSSSSARGERQALSQRVVIEGDLLPRP